MNYKSKMFSLKHDAVIATLAGLSLALLAGCQTTHPPESAPVTTTPPPVAATTPPVLATNKLTLPANPTAPSNSSDSMEPNILVWDATSKEYRAHPGEKLAPFAFSFTNVSPRQVVIYTTETSCDCTVAKLPGAPWTIPSGGTGKIDATIDLSQKLDVITNYIIVETSQGNRRLNVKAILPEAK